LLPDPSICVSDSTRGASWYALRVRSNHERAVRRLLELRGVDAFLPLYASESRWSDRVKTVERCLYPGYVFAHVLSLAPALECAGVCGVLGGIRPAVIPDAEIDSVRIVLASMHPKTPVEYAASLEPGDAVEIVAGALKGVIGKVQQHAKGLRLVVAVSMFGRGLAVELDAAALRKAAA
jgi:transcription termination/antitermination protein NusG